MTAPGDRFTEDDLDRRIERALRALTRPAEEGVDLPSFVSGPPLAGRIWPAVRVGAAAVASLVIAIGSVLFFIGSVGRPGSGAQPSDSWGPLAVVPPSNAVGEALAVGILNITDQCVVLKEAADDVLLLVWPEDRAMWNAKGRTITIENLDGSAFTLRDGDHVTFGGAGDSVKESGVSGEEWVKQMKWVAPPASSCPNDARWSVGEVVTQR